MVWAGVTSTGEKTSLIFIEEGVKTNQQVYLKLLKEQLIPWINRTFRDWDHSQTRRSHISYRKRCSRLKQIDKKLSVLHEIRFLRD